MRVRVGSCVSMGVEQMGSLVCYLFTIHTNDLWGDGDCSVFATLDASGISNGC